MIRKRSLRAGFTLVEALVVMAITGVLVALVMPAVQAARESARRVSCRNQLRQLGLGLHVYHDSHGIFPAGSYVMGPSFTIQSGWGWGAMILPSVDQAALYQQIDFGRGTGVGSNLAIISTALPVWRCASEPGPDRIVATPLDRPQFELAAGNYAGSEGILKGMSRVRMGDVRDGASQTLLLGERMVQSGLDGGLPYSSAWCGQVSFEDVYEYRSRPHLWPSADHRINMSPDDPLCFGSRHTGGANFVFADGSGRFLSENMALQVYEALGSANGSEAVEAP